MDPTATTLPTGRIQVPCEEPGCDLPCAYIERGCLVVHSHHHGRRHISRWALADLLALLAPPVPPCAEKGSSRG